MYPFGSWFDRRRWHRRCCLGLSLARSWSRYPRRQTLCCCHRWCWSLPLHKCRAGVALAAVPVAYLWKNVQSKHEDKNEDRQCMDSDTKVRNTTHVSSCSPLLFLSSASRTESVWGPATETHPWGTQTHATHKHMSKKSFFCNGWWTQEVVIIRWHWVSEWCMACETQ